MKKQRWAVYSTHGFTKYYDTGRGRRPYVNRWTRVLADIHWYATPEEAERSFDHSQYVVVPEEEVLADLVAEAVTPTDEALWPS